MNYPEGLKYTNEHEWVKLEGNVATVGITDYAQDQLGDIVYLELPEMNKQYEQGETFGVVESTKSVSDLYMPITGKVTAINEPLIDAPEKINEDPYGEAWMIKIELSKLSQLETLLNANEYQNQVSNS